MGAAPHGQADTTLPGHLRLGHRRVYFRPMKLHRARFALLYLAVLSLTIACGAPPREVAVEAQVTSTGPSRVPPAASTTVAPSMELPSPTAAPVPTPTATPSATTVPASPTISPPSPTPTYNPFAVLTPLALTPTVPPEPATPPERISIPKIGLDVRVLPVGVDRRGTFVVLDHDVAWYKQSGMPTQQTNIVMWAHVLRFRATPNIPAPFARVHELEIGDRITVTTAAGKQRTYVVTYQHRVRPDQIEYMAPTPLERITLISCIGARVMVAGRLSLAERLVTIGEPVE